MAPPGTKTWTKTTGTPQQDVGPDVRLLTADGAEAHSTARVAAKSRLLSGSTSDAVQVLLRVTPVSCPEVMHIHHLLPRSDQDWYHPTGICNGALRNKQYRILPTDVARGAPDTNAVHGGRRYGHRGCFLSAPVFSIPLAFGAYNTLTMCIFNEVVIW